MATPPMREVFFLLHLVISQTIARMFSNTAITVEKAAKMMADLRSKAPSAIGGAQVTAVRDYKIKTEKNMLAGEVCSIDLPSSNVLEFVLGQQGSVIARPSGTEPKVKFYYTAVGQTKKDAQALLDAMVKQMNA